MTLTHRLSIIRRGIFYSILINFVFHGVFMSVFPKLTASVMSRLLVSPSTGGSIGKAEDVLLDPGAGSAADSNLNHYQHNDFLSHYIDSIKGLTPQCLETSKETLKFFRIVGGSLEFATAALVWSIGCNKRGCMILLFITVLVLVVTSSTTKDMMLQIRPAELPKSLVLALDASIVRHFICAVFSLIAFLLVIFLSDKDSQFSPAATSQTIDFRIFFWIHLYAAIYFLRELYGLVYPGLSLSIFFSNTLGTSINVHEQALVLSVANAHVWGVASSFCLLCNPNWIVALVVISFVQFRLSFAMFRMGHLWDPYLLSVDQDNHQQQDNMANDFLSTSKRVNTLAAAHFASGFTSLILLVWYKVIASSKSKER